MQYPCGVFHDQNSYLPKACQKAKRVQKRASASCSKPQNPGAWRARFSMPHSVNLFDRWTSISATTWHTTTWHTSFWHAAATCCLVYLHHDGINNTFDFFLLCLELILFGQLVLVKPVQSVLHCRFDLLLVTTLELVLQLVVR